MQFLKRLSALITLGIALVGSGVSAAPVNAAVATRDVKTDLQKSDRTISVKGGLSRREESELEAASQDPNYRIVFIKGILGRRDDLQNPCRDSIFIKSALPIREDDVDVLQREESDIEQGVQGPCRGSLFIKNVIPIREDDY